MRKLTMICASVYVLFTAQVAHAANVYVAWACATDDSDDSLDCTPRYEDAYQDATGAWVIPIAEGDTVYFRVSDFWRPVGGTVVVSGKTEYEDSSHVNWTKSGSTATSPGETDELDLVLEIEGQTTAKVYKGRRNVKIDYQGG